MTLVALALRAGVEKGTVSRMRPELERRFPGLLGFARERVLAVAHAILADRGSGPVTGAALAALADVEKNTVSRMRPELERRFPGLLGSARERVLAAAQELAGRGSGPVTGAALAARAQAREQTVSRMRPELERKFPRLLRSAAG